MAQVAKRKLSSSTDGRAIKVVATASAGTTIHTAQSGTTAGKYDEIYLTACNTSTSTVLLTVQFGGTTAPDDSFQWTIPPNATIPFVDGWILQNAAIVRAFAASANVINLVGYVNQITP